MKIPTDIQSNQFYIENTTNFLMLKELVEKSPHGFFLTLIYAKTDSIKKLNIWINDCIQHTDITFKNTASKVKWILCNHAQKLNQRKIITDIQIKTNIYYKNNPKNFLLLKDLVELNPLGFFNTLRYEKTEQLKLLNIWINECTPMLVDKKYSISYKAYWILHNLIDFPLCKYCGIKMTEPKHYLGIFDGFRDFCCNRHAQKDLKTQETIKASLFKHYGYNVTSSLLIPEVKEKSEKTCERLYGNKKPIVTPEIQKKCKKRYLYNGIYFHSQPELALYIYLVDHNIPFKYHVSTYFTYEYDGKLHKYYPDFIIDGKIVEIKGDQFFDKNGKMKAPFRSQYKSEEQYIYACKNYEAKQKCMQENNVIIFRNNDYQKYLDYISDTYGPKYLLSFKNI